jgi:phosphatidylglycerophosphatase A
MKRTPLLPVIIGSGFGSGFWPWGPGTAGALVATTIWFLASMSVSSSSLIIGTIVFCVLFTILGTWAADKLEPYWGDDPSRVVIDEMVGVAFPLIVSPAGNIWYALASFLLFRFFDILKPLGIRFFDKKHGGFFVMADDILAGIYCLIIIAAARWII